MDRSKLRCTNRWAAVALLFGLLPSVGCVGEVTTAMYLMGGMDIKAEYTGLSEKRVVVVCRPVVETLYRNSTVAKELARQVSMLLQQNLYKIEVVDHREVAEWIDENSWQEYTEIAQALEADMVVGIDLENFNIFQGQTLYQGKADITIKVYEADGEYPVFEKTPDRILYPPNTGIPTSDKQESQFRRQFIRIAAEQIARHFYDHDPHLDFASDPTVLD